MILDLGRSSGGRRWIATMLVALLAALPVLVAPLPVLIDLPSHIARYHVEQMLPGSDALARHFTYGWRYLPNLGVDIAVAALGRAIGVEAATKLVMAAIPAIGAAAMVCIGRIVHGRVTFATIMALPLNYGFAFTFGFVNSCLSVSLAFATFAAWLALDRGDRLAAQMALAIVMAPIVLTAHIIGYGALGLMIGGAALARASAERSGPVAIATAALRRALPLAWPLSLLLVWRTSSGATIGRLFDWQLELQWLVMVVRDRYGLLDMVSAALLYAVALLPLLLPARFAAVRQLAVPALLLWVTAMLMPNRMFGSEFAAVRLIPVALALSLLAVRERGGASRRLVTAALVFAGIRLVATATSLVAASDAAERTLAALDRIAPGSRVAAIEVVDCDRRWAPPRFNHIASYATVRRDAFVNGQFAAVEGQLLGVRDSVPHDLAAFPTTGTLQGCERLSPTPMPQLLHQLPWAHIDYLWLINSGPSPIEVPHVARLIWNDGRSRLYAIDHGVRSKEI